MRLHLAEKRKETPSLCFVKALEPRALRGVNDRPKAIRQAAAFVGEADELPAPAIRVLGPTHQTGSVQAVDDARDRRTLDQKAVAYLAWRQGTVVVGEHAQDQSARGAQAERAQGQEEAIFVLKGRFKVRVGDEIFHCDEGGFAYVPKQVPHAFFNLTEEDGRIIVVYTPGGGQKFYQEFGPIARCGAHRATLAGVFTKHDMTLLGPPMTAD